MSKPGTTGPPGRSETLKGIQVLDASLELLSGHAGMHGAMLSVGNDIERVGCLHSASRDEGVEVGLGELLGFVAGETVLDNNQKSEVISVFVLLSPHVSAQLSPVKKFFLTSGC